MLNLMQPYLNQRTMVLRSALVDNYKETNSVVGDGVTHTFSAGEKSGWWGGNSIFTDATGSSLFGSSMTKRFLLNKDNDSGMPGMININFTVSEILSSSDTVGNDIDLTINNKFTIQLLKLTEALNKEYDSGLTSDGIVWQRESTKVSGPEGSNKYTSQYNISIPYEKAYNTTFYKNGHEQIKVHFESVADPSGDKSNFLLDDVVIKESLNEIVDEEHTDTFESDTGTEGSFDGWTGGLIKSYGQSENQNRFLVGGNVYGNDSVGTVSKTFARTNKESGVYISFDMVEIDSWDSETFSVKINDYEIELGMFRSDKNQFEGGYDNVADGIQWKRDDYVPFQLEGTSDRWYDQRHAYQIFVTDEFLDDNDSVKIEFTSGLDSQFLDESWAIDNFVIRNENNSEFNNDLDNFFVSGNDINIYETRTTSLKLPEMKVSKFDDFDGFIESAATNIYNFKLVLDGFKAIDQSFELANVRDVESYASQVTTALNDATARTKEYAQAAWQTVLEDDPVNHSLMGNLVTQIFNVSVGIAKLIAGGPTGIIGGVSTLIGTGGSLGSSMSAIAYQNELAEVPQNLGHIRPIENVTSAFEKVYLPFIEDESGNTEFSNLQKAVEDFQNGFGNLVANVQLASAVNDWKLFGEANNSGLDFYNTFAVGKPVGSHIQTSPPGLGFAVSGERTDSGSLYNHNAPSTRFEEWTITVESNTTDDNKLELWLPGRESEHNNELVYKFQKRWDNDDVLSHEWIDVVTNIEVA